MYDVNVLDAKDLDFGAFVNLQKESFAEIIGGTGTDYLFSEAYYRWKYSPPTGRGKVAVIKDRVGLLAVNSMYPLNIQIDGVRIRGWQSCDTATHPRGRGKGYFLKCLEKLKEELEDDDLFFGFPNQNSMRGFKKFGWKNHSDVRTWVRIHPSNKTAAFHAVEEIRHFTSELDSFFEMVAKNGIAMLERGVAYMTWRYMKHPFHEYKTFKWCEGGKLLGVVVLRRAKISGKELAIVMELFALTQGVERGLLAFSASWGRENGAMYTVVINNTTHLSNGILSGFLPIPTWALPKRQLLMGAANGIKAETVWNAPWCIQIGDWDGL